MKLTEYHYMEITKNTLSENWIILLVTFLAGIAINIFSQSILLFLLSTTFFILCVSGILWVLGRLINEVNHPRKRLILFVVSLFMLGVSWLIISEQTDNKPWSCADAGLDLSGPYPIWYKNPLTRQCAYRMEWLCFGQAGKENSYWFSSGECAQAEKEKIFQDDFPKESPNKSQFSKNIDKQCQEINMRSHYVVSLVTLNKEIDAYKAQIFTQCKGSPELDMCKRDLQKFKDRMKQNILADRNEFFDGLISTVLEKEFGVSAKELVKSCPGYVSYEDLLVVLDSIKMDKDKSLALGMIVPAIESTRMLADRCLEAGGILQSGNAGERICSGVKPPGFVPHTWPELGACGERAIDTKWVVVNGEGRKWDVTLNCKNIIACNGPENALCSQDGCKLSSACSGVAVK